VPLLNLFIFKFILSTRAYPRYCRLSCGTDKISWVMLDPMAYGQQTQHNPTDVVTPYRLSLFASLTVPRNPNLTFHNGDTEYVLGGLTTFEK